MHFDLPMEIVFPVDEAVIRLDPGPHPLAANREEIEANWRREIARTPTLFNGEVAMLSRLSWREGRVLGLCHIVDYATFLYWRSLRPLPDAGHVYTHAMLVTTDNALVAIRMGVGTVNAGAVYFAAGSFEPADFREGVADLEFNMHREVREETGIDISTLPRERAFHGLSKTTGTVLFKRYFLPFDAEEAEQRIRDHVASEQDPEIEGAVTIRDPQGVPAGLASQMPALVAWHFANPPEHVGVR